MKRSEQINEVSAALSRAQGQMRSAPKSKVNPHFRSRYADLPALWEVARQALAENGLALLQLPQPAQGGIQIETVVTHSSGQWISDDGLYVPAMKLDAQGYGSAMTYARRYALGAMLGLVSDEDDDGNAASVPLKAAEQPQAAPELLAKAKTAALAGTASYAAFFKALTPAERNGIGTSRHADLKALAAENDPPAVAA